MPRRHVFYLGARAPGRRRWCASCGRKYWWHSDIFFLSGLLLFLGIGCFILAAYPDAVRAYFRVPMVP